MVFWNLFWGWGTFGFAMPYTFKNPKESMWGSEKEAGKWPSQAALVSQLRHQVG